MPRARRGRPTDVLEVNLTPLLDIVLQLITFFMMLVHFGARIEGATESVRLPVASAAMPGASMELERLAVTIDEDGALVANGRALGPLEAASWWAEQARTRAEGREVIGRGRGVLPTRVVVRADREAPYGAVRKTLAMAQSRGFAHFTLVVLRVREGHP